MNRVKRLTIAALTTALLLIAALGCGGSQQPAIFMPGETTKQAPAEEAPPQGIELAKHTHLGSVYSLVEFDGRVAVMDANVQPVTNPSLASDVLHSYAWAGAISNLDLAALNADARTALALESQLSDARSASNDMVDTFDELESLSADVPLLGSVSAMDVLRRTFSEVDDAESLARELDAKLDSLSANANTVQTTADRIGNLDAASVSGADMDTLFGNARDAADSLQSDVAYALDKVSELRRMASLLEDALWDASDTPIIGDSIADGAATATEFGDSLGDLESALLDSETALASLSSRFGASIQEANRAHDGYVARWLQDPSGGQQTVAIVRTAAPTAVRVIPTPVPTAAPTPVPATATPAPLARQHTEPVRVLAGTHFTCALNSDGSAVCWGSDSEGLSSPPEDERFAALADGTPIHFSCGLRADGSAVCWGSNYFGESSPPLDERFSVISAGYSNYGCGLRVSDGSAVCWGANYYGESSPPSGSFTAISAGGIHTCGLRSDGAAVCWGDNSDGQATPPKDEKFTAISSGDGHTCGLRADGSVICWGYSDGGD